MYTVHRLPLCSVYTVFNCFQLCIVQYVHNVMYCSIYTCASASVFTVFKMCQCAMFSISGLWKCPIVFACTVCAVCSVSKCRMPVFQCISVYFVSVCQFVQCVQFVSVPLFAVCPWARVWVSQCVCTVYNCWQCVSVQLLTVCNGIQCASVPVCIGCTSASLPAG